MKYARSSFYYSPVEKTAEQRHVQLQIETQIESIAQEYPRYGYRRMTKELGRRGLHVNHKKVLGIMRQKGLLCRPKRKFVITTNSKHNYRIYPNLIKGKTITELNEVWIADITYIRLLKSFVYLAAILDAFSRKAIGYALSKNIDTRLTKQALEMAITNRKEVKGVIHHSDRGVQYASDDYVRALKNRGILISMSRKANPYDNAMMESFMKTLKYEEVYLWEYETMEDAQKRIPYFIEQVYNQKRLHSSLGYCPPVEFEEMFLNKSGVFSPVTS